MMKKPLYTSPDIEVDKHYREFLKEYQNIETRETTYANELAIADAHVNRLLNPDEENPIDPDLWRLILETLKFKVLIIKEQRLEYDRIEKRKQTRTVPIEDLDQIMRDFLTAVMPYVGEQDQALVLSKINLVLTTVNNRV